MLSLGLTASEEISRKTTAPARVRAWGSANRKYQQEMIGTDQLFHVFIIYHFDDGPSKLHHTRSVYTSWHMVSVHFIIDDPSTRRHTRSVHTASYMVSVGLHFVIRGQCTLHTRSDYTSSYTARVHFIHGECTLRHTRSIYTSSYTRSARSVHISSYTINAQTTSVPYACSLYVLDANKPYSQNTGTRGWRLITKLVLIW